MRVLIVDDSRVTRMMVRRALAAIAATRDAEVLEAADADEAEQTVASCAPDLILSDWNMPGRNGIELLGAVRAAGSRAPFGLVTSESTPQMHDRAMDAGADFLVSKPFTADMLEQALARSRAV